MLYIEAKGNPNFAIPWARTHLTDLDFADHIALLDRTKVGLQESLDQGFPNILAGGLHHLSNTVGAGN